MLKAQPHCCEEMVALPGGGVLPCNKPATKVIDVNRPGSTEGPYRMCDSCADHSVRNRGMKLVGPYRPAAAPGSIFDAPTSFVRVYRMPDKLTDGLCFGAGRPIPFLNVDWFEVPDDMSWEDVVSFIKPKQYFDHTARFLILGDRPDLVFTIGPAVAR